MSKTTFGFLFFIILIIGAGVAYVLLGGQIRDQATKAEFDPYAGKIVKYASTYSKLLEVINNNKFTTVYITCDPKTTSTVVMSAIGFNEYQSPHDLPDGESKCYFYVSVTKSALLTLLKQTNVTKVEVQTISIPNPTKFN